ncbi:MAG TPA: hypothetical protein ENJ00_10035 [Phycisphaerales bacterium]|nr:hypothetical protein [Phycisphaerales bacterium]
MQMHRQLDTLRNVARCIDHARHAPVQLLLLGQLRPDGLLVVAALTQLTPVLARSDPVDHPGDQHRTPI